MKKKRKSEKSNVIEALITNKLDLLIFPQRIKLHVGNDEMHVNNDTV